MRSIRALVVDDEPTSRKRIRDLLEDRPGFELAGECRNGREAALSTAELEPDLVFLDVEMPEMNGFEFLERLQDRVPAVIFVSAYESHALRAFDVDPIDFLKKPFDDERFDRALGRARSYLRLEGGRSIRTRLDRLLRDLGHEGNNGDARASDESLHRYSDRLLLKDDDRAFFVKIEDIDWIEAADYYARVHVGPRSFLVRVSLNELEEKLDPALFTRIHRSTIVNVERISELRPWFSGSHLVVLEDGTELRMSRGRRESLSDLLGRSV